MNNVTENAIIRNGWGRGETMPSPFIYRYTPLEIENIMYYTYVLKSKKDGRMYTGSTTDLRKRFNQHNSGEVYSTKNRGPFIIVYYEACLNEQNARVREKYLKTGMGKRYLKNRLKRFLSLTG